MNIKTYSFTKYIATLGAIFLFTAPLLAFLEAWKNIFNGNYTTEAALTWVFEIVGVLLIIGYLYIRERLKAKSKYVYTKDDKKWLNLSFLMYGLLILFSFVYVIIGCGVLGKNGVPYAPDPAKHNSKEWIAGAHRTGLMIAFAPLYVFTFAAGICAAIFESLSRVKEQQFLYNEQYEEGKIKDPKNKAKSNTGTKRTAQAQALLEKEEIPSKIETETPIKTKGSETINDAKELEDFFNTDDDEEDDSPLENPLLQPSVEPKKEVKKKKTTKPRSKEAEALLGKDDNKQKED